MLNKETFKKGLKELQSAFDGFRVNDSKITTWYKYSKFLDDDMFLVKIENCIRGCRKAPTLADILDQNEYYSGEGTEHIGSANSCYKRCFGNCGVSRSDSLKKSCEYCFSNLR